MKKRCKDKFKTEFDNLNQMSLYNINILVNDVRENFDKVKVFETEKIKIEDLNKQLQNIIKNINDVKFNMLNKFNYSENNIKDNEKYGYGYDKSKTNRFFEYTEIDSNTYDSKNYNEFLKFNDNICYFTILNILLIVANLYNFYFPSIISEISSEKNDIVDEFKNLLSGINILTQKDIQIINSILKSIEHNYKYFLRSNVDMNTNMNMKNQDGPPERTQGVMYDIIKWNRIKSFY
jgi:hypothetical protein